jgi:hypothetical protein
MCRFRIPSRFYRGLHHIRRISYIYLVVRVLMWLDDRFLDPPVQMLLRLLGIA